MSLSLDEIFRALRREIVFGRLKPRERLLEIQLAEQFGVGRYVIRAAIEELDRQGLVERRPNRGAVVVDFSTSDVEQIYEMRDLLQSEAVRRMTLPVSEEKLAMLRAINADYEEQLKCDNLDGIAAANDLFHAELFSLCRNRYLYEAIMHYWHKSAVIHSYAIGRPELVRLSHQQHSAMIEALATQDRSALALLCTEHMQPALGAYKELHGGWAWQEAKPRQQHANGGKG